LARTISDAFKIVGPDWKAADRPKVELPKSNLLVAEELANKLEVSDRTTMQSAKRDERRFIYLSFLSESFRVEGRQDACAPN
jgi:hypothetical protein